MAKRFADSQMTRETFKEDDSDGDNGATSSHKLASAAVMNKRRIAMPKKRTAEFSSQSVDNDSFTKPHNEPQLFNGTFNSHGGNTSSKNDDENAKLKALNLQFRDKIVDFVEKDGFADLRPVLDKYKTYMESIKNSPKPVQTPKPPFPSFNITPNASANSEGALEPLEIEDEKLTSSEEEKEAKVEGPTFTLKSKPTTSDSVFSFGAKKNDSDSDGDNDSDSIEIKGPQFTFSGTVKSDVFKLKAFNEKEKEDKKVEAEEVIGTNSSITDASDGPSVNSAKPAFSFGNLSTSAEIKDKPTFTFGSTNSKPNDQPSFSFGHQENKEPKPSSSFNFTAPSANTTTNDTASDAAKPSFSFKFGGAQSEQKDKQSNPVKPAFSFSSVVANNENKEGTKPAFSFGSSNSSAAPSFTFGKSASSTKDTNETNSNSSNGFKFSLPFGQRPSEATDSLAPSTGDKAENTITDVTESQEDQEASTPLDLQNGEENETPLFTQRSKLMLFNTETQSYDSKGVGEMKLLQRKDDKSKVRLLCRSDGMGNILLNTTIVKTFTYSPLAAENENLIKIPTVDAEGKLVTYVVKFKQKSDGRQLIKSIEDAKKDM